MNKSFSTPSSFNSFVDFKFRFNDHSVYLDIFIPPFCSKSFKDMDVEQIEYFNHKNWNVSSIDLREKLKSTGYHCDSSPYYLLDYTDAYKDKISKLKEKKCSSCVDTIDTLLKNNSHYFSHDFNCKFDIKNNKNKIADLNLKIVDLEKKNSRLKSLLLENSKIIDSPKISIKEIKDDIGIKRSYPINLKFASLGLKMVDNKWFGFNNNDSLKSAFSFLKLNISLMSLSEFSFDSYSISVKTKILFAIKKLSNFFHCNIYLKIVNSLFNKHDSSFFDNLCSRFFESDKKSLIFLKFFYNFCPLYDVSNKSISSGNLLNDNNYKNAVLDFQDCMCNFALRKKTNNSVCVYTIKNFEEWYVNNLEKIKLMIFNTRIEQLIDEKETHL